MEVVVRGAGGEVREVAGWLVGGAGKGRYEDVFACTR